MVLLLESPVAKKKPPKPEPRKPGRPPSSQPLNRVDFWAPPEWVDELDECARLAGMSRAAYVRSACIDRMRTDRKARDE